MGRRSLPVLLVIAAAVADVAGAHALAFDAVIAAIPFAAVAALDVFGGHLERRDDPLRGVQALLWGVVLVLLVISGAARSPAARTHELPSVAWSALVACLAVLALKGLLAAAPHARRGGSFRLAKP